MTSSEQQLSPDSYRGAPPGIAEAPSGRRLARGLLCDARLSSSGQKDIRDSLARPSGRLGHTVSPPSGSHFATRRSSGRGRLLIKSLYSIRSISPSPWRDGRAVPHPHDVGSTHLPPGGQPGEVVRVLTVSATRSTTPLLYSDRIRETPLGGLQRRRFDETTTVHPQVTALIYTPSSPLSP